MSTFAQAAHVPFFDRLLGESPTSSDESRLDASALKASVLRDLHRLFNVRNGLTIEQFLACDGSVIHYGLPDLLALSPNSAGGREALERVVRHALALFEPRLSDVTVQAQTDLMAHSRLQLKLAATVQLHLQACRVDFDLVMDERTALVVVPA